MTGWILVVAPHFDDEVLGCGGTICRLTREAGYRIAVVYMTSAPCTTSPSAPPNSRSEIELEMRSAGAILGVSEQVLFTYPARTLVYTWEMVARLTELIRRWAPAAVFAPHSGERDRDHRISYEVAREAVVISGKPDFPELGKAVNVPRMFLYEVWTPLTTIHHREDITQYADLKQQALAAYTSKFSPEVVPHLLGLNAYRNALHNHLCYTEVFQFGS